MKRNNMLEGSVLKSIILFGLPIMLSSILQFSYSFVDNVIVGRYVSTSALAAVGNVGSINSFIIGAALGMTAGFTIPVAHAFGAKNKEKVAHFAGSSIVVAALIGVLIVIIAHIISTPLLKAIGTPENVIGLSSRYVRILYFGIPFQMLSNCFTAISQSVGESKKPLYFLFVSVGTNLFLDILFVKTLRMGVEGAALATIISEFVAMSVIGTYVIKFNKEVEITKKDLKLDKKTALMQIKLGIPVSLQFTITSIGSMILQSAVNSFGATVMAGFTAANKVENITNVPMSALGVSTSTFVGQNFGAKNYDRIVKSVRKIFFMDLIVSIFMSLILFYVGPHAVSLFMTTQDAAIMAAAKRYILAISQLYSFVAILFVLRNSLQGMGFTYANTIAGIGELCGRIFIALVLTPLVGFSAVCYAGPAAWILADIPLFIIYLKKEKKFKELAKEEALKKVNSVEKN